MGRDHNNPGRGDPESKRTAPRGGGVRKQTGYLGRATASDAGHSGYGTESIRPYLRAQLKFKELMRSPFMQGMAWDRTSRKKATGTR